MINREKKRMVKMHQVLKWLKLLQYNAIQYTTVSTKSEVVHAFTSNKYYTYLLNIEPDNFQFLRTLILMILSSDLRIKMGRMLKIKDKISLKLLINKSEPRTRKYV